MLPGEESKGGFYQLVWIAVVFRTDCSLVRNLKDCFARRRGRELRMT
jgi:hypothetical protein